MKQEIIHVVDSLGVTHEQVVERADWTISRFFVEGGPSAMIILTVLLIALLVAAWKAPKWVKEIGISALVAGVFFTLVGLTQMFNAIQTFGHISFSVTCGGLKVALITAIYGLCIYFLSLIIRIIQKPRI
ncbi:MAG: MotA/TolQ/ExbB proton channel family protein [Bacteroidales bacterium]|nr:MotA/TolQ/ExbB proton channel family protein [Bacteroidales bacterium]MDY6443817.1 MotA/TolQ/ExbB proton channel family protein [Bacteroidales bacterium]